MNVDNENIEPVTDLGLALGYSNQCIQRRLNNDSGAGANAGSGIKTRCVANNPLSELVWSPHKGLSLKCADSSFADTKTSLFWGAGPSNVALLPAKSITDWNFTNDKNIDGENFPIPFTSFQMKTEVAGKDTLIRSPGSDTGVHGPSHEDETGTGGKMEEINTVVGVSALNINQNEELGHSKGDGPTGTRENHFPSFPDQVNINKTDILSMKSDQPKPDEEQTEAFSGDSVGENRNIDRNNHKTKMNFILTSEAHRVNESRAHGDPIANQIFQGRKCLEKMESTSENDLQNVKREYVCGAANETVALELSTEVSSSWHTEEKHSENKTALIENSPTNIRVPVNRRKDKEKAKALSDGDLDGMMSKDEDDSHESVESCNSAAIFSKGKRRRSFEEDLVVGSKAFKKQIHCTQGSTSFTRQDSSFMNWILNMTKGFSKSSQDKAPFPLNMTPQDDGHENPDKNLITFKKNQDPGSKIIGFRSIFQSLYCAKAEVQETRMLNVEGEGSKEFEPSNKMPCATPIACHGENSNLNRQFLLLNERFNESTSVNEEDSAMQPKMLLDKFSGSQEKGNTKSEENDNNKFHLALSKEKKRTSSNSSLGKQNTNSAEKADSADKPSFAKTTSKFCHRNDPLGSFWVTRFAPKTLNSSSNLDHLNPNVGACSKLSTECLKLIPPAQNHAGFHTDSTSLEGRDHFAEDLQLVCGEELENSATRLKSPNDQKPMYNLNSISPSPKLKSSDAMASVFARRLDALKHITSSTATGDAVHATVTCFFCGIKGHNLQDCSEISEIELVELLRNLNTYTGAEELSCFCIRCFQHNHWAVACPTKRLHVESNASSDEIQVNSGNKGNSKLQTGKVNQYQAAVAHIFGEGDEFRTDTSFNCKVGEMTEFNKRGSLTSPVNKHIASSSGKNMSKENQIMPLSYFVSEQNLDAPEGLFEVVKSLCLSRTDILKWMNYRTSLSQIDGFFLRLRLGKWEEGLGGTGYHVARIVGMQRENKPEDGKSTILVDVLGYRCLVESQYVSNHDFLEDELMAWWSTTSRNGGKIPSEEDLRTKVKTKKMLGF